MPPTVILIRHGQALHNVSHYEIHDPVLSELGQQQCRDLQDHLRTKLPLADQVEAIVTSPMIRTIETTLLGLDWLIKRGVPVTADALWQENSSKPCDTGSPISLLTPRFPTIDFSTVDPIYPSKTKDTPYAFTKSKVLNRGKLCLQNLYQRPEKVIAVVTHSGFLRCAISHTKYENADYRIFSFAENTSPETPELVEWKETAERGGGLGLSEIGRAEISDRDFPAEKMDEVEEKLGEKSSGEAVGEVP